MSTKERFDALSHILEKTQSIELGRNMELENYRLIPQCVRSWHECLWEQLQEDSG